MGEAADRFAQLTRNTWEDFKKTYQPWAEALINSTSLMSPGVVTEAVNSAIDRVNNAYTALGRVSDATLSAYGTAITPQQRAYRDHITSIDKTAAIVDAANNIRARIADRDRMLALTGIPNLAGRNYGG